MVIAFAGFSVLCHAVVFSGGGLYSLFIASGVVGCLSFLGWRIGRGRETEIASRDSSLENSERDEGGESTEVTSIRMRVVVTAASLALTAGFVLTKHFILFWWLSLLFFLFALYQVFGNAESEPQSSDDHARPWRVPLWILAAAGALLPLVAQRPTADSPYYINTALWIANRPGSALLGADTLFGIPDLPILLPLYKLATYEVLAGAVTWLTGLSAIQVFHLLLPCVFGLFAVLAHARLIRRLAPQTWIWILVPVLSVLVFIGEENRYYGNFAFLRLHEGKGVFLTVFVPLLMVYGLEFARDPSRRNWFLLCGAQIAALGMSTTALWAAPAVAGLALASGSRLSWLGLRTLLIGLLASAYNVALALAMRSEMAAAVQALLDSSMSRPGKYLIQAAWTEVLGTGALSASCLFAAFAAWCFCPAGIGRRVCVIFPLGVALILLNPYLAPLISSNVTGGPAYFRVLWALPVPLFLGIILASPVSTARGAFPSWARIAAYVTATVCFLLFVPKIQGLSPSNDVHFEFLGLKVPANRYAVAKTLVENVPGGSQVLVPAKVTLWISTFRDHPYSLIPRRSYLKIQASQIDPEDAALRRWLVSYVGGTKRRSDDSARIFKDGIKRFDLSGVCFARTAHWAKEIRSVLNAEGFAFVDSRGDYETWVRR